jgi:hypothetical protein
MNGSDQPISSAMMQAADFRLFLVILAFIALLVVLLVPEPRLIAPPWLPESIYPIPAVP